LLLLRSSAGKFSLNLFGSFLVPPKLLLHFLDSTGEESVAKGFMFGSGVHQVAQLKHILEWESRVVLKVPSQLLWVAESVHEASGDDSILHCLVDLDGDITGA
jgi:hypothetical protein